MTNTRTRTLWMGTLLIAGAGALVNSCDSQDDAFDPLIDGRADDVRRVGALPTDLPASSHVPNIRSQVLIEPVPMHHT